MGNQPSANNNEFAKKIAGEITSLIGSDSKQKHALQSKLRDAQQELRLREVQHELRLREVQHELRLREAQQELRLREAQQEIETARQIFNLNEQKPYDAENNLRTAKRNYFHILNEIHGKDAAKNIFLNPE